MIGLQLGSFIISSFCREKMERIHLKQNPSSLSFFSLDFGSSCPAVNGWYDDEPPIFPPERMTYTQKMITPTTAHGIARNHSPSLNSLSRFTNNKSDTSSNKIAIVVQKDCFTENILCVKWIRIKFSYQLEHNLIIFENTWIQCILQCFSTTYISRCSHSSNADVGGLDLRYAAFVK